MVFFYFFFPQNKPSEGLHFSGKGFNRRYFVLLFSLFYSEFQNQKKWIMPGGPWKLRQHFWVTITSWTLCKESKAVFVIALTSENACMNSLLLPFSLSRDGCPVEHGEPFVLCLLCV